VERGQEEGPDLRTQVHFCYGGAQRFEGLPISTHTLLAKKERKWICLQRRYHVSSGHLRLLLKACTVKFIAVI
jgi:hypothetical protein